jgi:hypothetical protein
VLYGTAPALVTPHEYRWRFGDHRLATPRRTGWPLGQLTPRELGLIYTRVSDDKQSGASSQLTGTRRVASLSDVEVVAEINDDGISGDDLDREGLNEVLAILERYHRAGRSISWVIPDKTDRLSRADSLDTAAVYAQMRRLDAPAWRPHHWYSEPQL